MKKNAEENKIPELLAIFQDKTKNYQERSNAFYEYVQSNDPNIFNVLKAIIDDKNEDQIHVDSAIWQLGYTGPKNQEIDVYLLKLLEINDLHDQALRSLASRGTKDAVSSIVKKIVSSPDSYLRKELAESLRSNYSLSWQQRLEMVLKEINSSNIRPESIDETAIVTAIIDKGAAPTQNKDHIIEELIKKSVDQDKRMTGIFAKLIIELSSGSQSIAGQKISEFEASSGISSEQLKNLRIAIGGETALDPFLRILTNNLEKNFQEPISTLNDDTHQNWKKTIKYAQYGFMTRMIMSVVVFIVGIMLLCVSSYQFFWGNIGSGELFGVGISFVAGLGTMLTVVYSGPLRQIRESVNDLGIASAAFIAYVHRVLEISHTFSFYYLNQKITFAEMTKSSKLIDEAMKNTIELLSDKSAKIKN